MQSINNHIVRTECPIDMKQVTLKKKIKSLNCMPKQQQQQQF